MTAPVLSGDPRNPPVFRKTTRRSPAQRDPGGPFAGRIENPPADAIATGFDSRNGSRRKAMAAARAAAARRLGQAKAVPNGSSTTLSYAAAVQAQRRFRRGMAVPDGLEAASLQSSPPRRVPRAAPDPFAPLGVRAGTILLQPALELWTGFNSNPAGVPGGKDSSIYLFAPELLARSDWSRHELTANLRGSYTTFGNESRFVPALYRPNADARINGRIDVTGRTRVDLEGRFLLGTDAPNSPNLQAGLARLPVFTTLGGSLGASERFNRFEVGLKGSLDRISFQNSLLTDGTSSSNADRAYNQYGAQLRGAYELVPGVKPFAAFEADRRVHDLQFDSSGFERGSYATTPRLGSSFVLSGKLNGELSVGYVTRSYDDPRLPTVRGAAFDGSLVWLASALTTATLSARTLVNESTVAGVSGSFTSNYLLQVDHAFQRWLVGTLKLGYGTDDYVGLDRTDRRTSAALGLIYKFNRELQFKTELREDWLRSNVSGVSYVASAVLFGLRLQR
jgi:hypothetical protein